MVRTTWCLIGLAALALPPQSHPDFSGRWTLDTAEQPAADVARVLTVRQVIVDRNVRGEPMTPFVKEIAIDRESASGTRSETHHVGVSGGVVPGLDEAGKSIGAQQRFAVHWDAYTLVFENSRNTSQDPGTEVWAERTERWSLAPDGRLHVVISTRGAGGDPTTVTLVYRRP